MDKVKKITLKNGMDLLLVPQTGAASMTLLVLSKVGSRYETAKLSGASHFIEHLMFKGTEKRPTTRDISQELDGYGAEYNAYTGKDMTGYYVKMDAAHTDVAVDMLHDMLFHSKFDAEELNRERGVILEEIKMYEDNPRDHIADLLEGKLFQGSTLGWNIAGSRKTVSGMRRADMLAYRDAYYVPGRMTVILAGKILPGVQQLFAKTFGHVTAPKKRADAPFACFKNPRKIAQPIAYLEKKTEQVQLVLGFYGLPYGHADKQAAQLLGLILGGTMSSRLFIEIRERRGLCYAIRAGHDSLEDTGAFTVSAGLDKARFPEAIKAIYGELNRIMQEPVSKGELERAKEHIQGRMRLAFEDSAARAEWYGRQWLFERKLETPEKRLAKIRQVTADDIRRVARSLLNPQRMAIAAIGPLGNAAKFKSLISWK